MTISWNNKMYRSNYSNKKDHLSVFYLIKINAFDKDQNQSINTLSDTKSFTVNKLNEILVCL